VHCVSRPQTTTTTVAFEPIVVLLAGAATEDLSFDRRRRLRLHQEEEEEVLLYCVLHIQEGAIEVGEGGFLWLSLARLTNDSRPRWSFGRKSARGGGSFVNGPLLLSFQVPNAGGNISRTNALE